MGRPAPSPGGGPPGDGASPRCYECEHSPNLSCSMSSGFLPPGGKSLPVAESQRQKVLSTMDPWSVMVGRSNCMVLSSTLREAGRLVRRIRGLPKGRLHVGKGSVVGRTQCTDRAFNFLACPRRPAVAQRRHVRRSSPGRGFCGKVATRGTWGIAKELRLEGRRLTDGAGWRRSARSSRGRARRDSGAPASPAGGGSSAEGGFGEPRQCPVPRG